MAISYIDTYQVMRADAAKRRAKIATTIDKARLFRDDAAAKDQKPAPKRRVYSFDIHGGGIDIEA